MANFRNETIPLIVDSAGNIIKKANEYVACNYNQTRFFLIYIIAILLIFLLIRYKNEIKDFIQVKKANLGYIKIWMRLDNMKLKEKMVKADNFKNFEFKKTKYNLDMMHDFIFGYDINNVPVFMYDKNFIIPLKLEQGKITEEIKKQLKLATGKEPSEDEIGQFKLKIDTKTFTTVYNRKLLSDLYSASMGDDIFKNKIILYIIIAVAVFVAYQTGLLDYLLETVQNFSVTGE